jgi:hypothetical protein
MVLFTSKFSGELPFCPCGSLSSIMAAGNKKVAKEKVVDPFSKKHWYEENTSTYIEQNLRNIGKMLVKRIHEPKIASMALNVVCLK